MIAICLKSIFFVASDIFLSAIPYKIKDTLIIDITIAPFEIGFCALLNNLNV